MFFENLLQALSAIRMNKMRSFLTMLGIIIGISAVIAIVTLGESMQTFINSNMQSMGASMIVVAVRQKSDDELNMMEMNMGSRFDDIEYQPQNADFLSAEDIAQMKEVFGERINAVGILEMGAQSGAYLQEGRRKANVTVNGTNADFYRAYGIDLLSGRWVTDVDEAALKRVAVISERSAEKLFGDNNSALGKEVDLHAGSKVQSYSVIGVYKYESQLAGMMMAGDVPTDVYIPNSIVKLDSGLPKNYSTIYVSGQIDESVQKLTDDLNTYLKPLYRHNRNFEAVAQNFEGQLETFNTIIGMVTLAIGIIAAISLVVGGVGVMNIMLVSVTERTREIGTRKAIGARSSSIRSQFIIESLILCAIGGVLGVLLGGLLGLIGSSIVGFPSFPPPYAIVVSVLFSVLIGVFFGAYPASKASALQPIEALRYE